jgi:hypothetical protein
MPKEFPEIPAQSLETTQNADTKLRDDALRPEPPRFGVLAAETGLIPRVKDDRLEFYLKVSGEDRLLFSTDRTAKGLDEARNKIRDLVSSKQSDLTTRYGVRFSSENEVADRQWVIAPDGSMSKGDEIKSRPPKLAELYGIEAALAKAQPSHLSKDGKDGVKFYFLKESFIKDEGSDTIAFYVNKDTQGKPAVYMQPFATQGRPITEKDGPVAGEYSLESLLTHELGHNTEYTLNWPDEKTLIDVSKRLGWAPYEDPTTHETIWLIETKNHQFYKLIEGEDWVRCNATGHMVDKTSQPVDDVAKAEHATASQVRDAALVRPPTEYFDNVVEMFAEAIMLYRVSPAKRADLLKQSPSLYAFVKEQDQAEIDLHHGKDAKQQSKLLRLPDGQLVPNTSESRTQIADFEKPLQQKN